MSWYHRGMISAISFDCFGVLTQDGWLAFLEKYATPKNTVQLHDLNYQEDRGHISYEQFLLSVTDLTTASKSEIHRMITTGLHPNLAVFRLIERIKTAGYKLGVISNVGQSLEAYVPKQYLQVFDVVTISADLGILKPQAAIYEHHLHKLGVAPNEAIFIDDRQANVDGANAVGMMGIYFTDAGQLETRLRELGISI